MKKKSRRKFKNFFEFRFKEKKEKGEEEKLEKVKMKTGKKESVCTTTTTKKSTTYKTFSKHPKLENIDAGASLPGGKDFFYNIIEKPKGASFCITYFSNEEDFEINYAKKETRRDKEELLTLEANINAESMALYKAFRELADKLGGGHVDFTVFAEYVSFDNQVCKYFSEDDGLARVIISDIFINDNWIRHKDLIPLCESCGLEIMPILYEGNYSKSILDLYANEVSSTINSEEKVYGIVIKAVLEEERNSKRIAKEFINKKFEKKTENLFDVKKEVEGYIKKSFPESKRLFIDSEVKKEFPDFFEEQKKATTIDLVLPFAVSKTKTVFFSGLKFLKAFKKETAKKTEKEINKRLSEIFIKRYGMFNGGESGY